MIFSIPASGQPPSSPWLIRPSVTLIRKPGSVLPTPPTLAPVLAVSADFGSYIAVLEWTPSNKTGSPGFGYNIYRQIGNAAWLLIDTVGAGVLTYSDDMESSSPDVFKYYITPKNDAGEGPSSNTVEISLPGESEAPTLTGPDVLLDGEPTVIEWTEVVGAEGYRVEVKTDLEDWTQLDIVTGDTSLEVFPDMDSLYRVFAFRTLPVEVETGPSNEHAITYVTHAPWVLYGGTWNDGGAWRDSQFWTDN